MVCANTRKADQPDNVSLLKAPGSPGIEADDELEIAINGIIEQIEDDTFFFNALCDTLMVKAQNENKIDNAPNTVYLSNNLDAKEYERVSIILWKKIWAHELCLNFHSNETNFNNYSFIILKRNE